MHFHVRLLPTSHKCYCAVNIKVIIKDIILKCEKKLELKWADTTSYKTVGIVFCFIFEYMCHIYLCIFPSIGIFTHWTASMEILQAPLIGQILTAQQLYKFAKDFIQCIILCVYWWNPTICWTPKTMICKWLKAITLAEYHLILKTMYFTFKSNS